MTVQGLIDTVARGNLNAAPALGHSETEGVMGFSFDIANFAKKANGNADQVVRKTVLDIGTRLVERTPVGDATYWAHPAPPGYVGGYARANWQHSIGAPIISEVAGVDASGSGTNARIMASVPVKAGGLVHFITNSVPYIQRLEDGHSRQCPPNGMVGLTVTEFQGIVGTAAGGVK